MVLPLVAKAAITAAARLAPTIATKVPRVAPLAAKALAKITGKIPVGGARITAAEAARRSALLAKSVAARGVPAVPALAPIKAAMTKLAVRAVEKPFRTALPYAATAGMLGAVSRIGEERAITAVDRGALVGEVLTGVPVAPPGLGVARMPRTVGMVPIPEPVVVRSWTTGTTNFAVDSTGKHWVLTKTGWKKYTPKKPIVLGTKHLTPKKFIAAAKKYYGLKKELDKVFKTVKKKK